MKKYVLVFLLIACILSSCAVPAQENEIPALETQITTSAEQSEHLSSPSPKPNDQESQEEMPAAYYDYFPTVFHESIQEGMPEFTFELIAYFDTNINGYSLEKLKITHSDTGEVIQEILIPELTLFGQTDVYADDETMGFKLEDLNFDGYSDIRLYDTANGNYRVEWIYFVWNPVKQTFENDRRLNEISLASFDQEKQLIYGMERSGAANHWYYTYQYRDGEITLIELISDTSVSFPDNITAEQIAEVMPAYNRETALQYIVTKRLNDVSLELEITEEIYELYIPNEWTLLEEHEADSPVGKALKRLIG